MEERFKVAVAQALEDLKSDPETRVVQLFGSVHRGEPHEHSDMDIYVLSSRSAFWRICKEYNGVQAEAVFGPQKGFEKILLSRDMLSVQAFALGGTLLDRDGTAPALVALARKIYDAGPPPMPSAQVTKNRAVLTRRIHKLTRLPEDSVESRVVANDAVQTVVLAFYQHHRMWMHNLTHRVKLIEEKDARMGQLLRDFYLGGQKPRQAIAVIEAMLEQLGGPLEEFVSEQVPWPSRPQPSSEGNPG
jgi:hypothetical protein